MVTSATASNCREADGVARETAPVPHRVSCPAFVGRAEELDVLEATLARVAAGAAATVLVAGDAGIGKTRLVDEFCGRARGGGALVATGVCVPIEGGGLPYGPIVGIFRDLVRQSSDGELSDLLAPMASGLGLGPAGAAARAGAYPAARSVADELAKTRRFESVLACVTALAERSPVVLVLEDLHWADSTSAELLGFLTRNLDASRVLLIGTYRTRRARPRPPAAPVAERAEPAHARRAGAPRGPRPRARWRR